MSTRKKRIIGITFVLILAACSPFIIREYRAETKLKEADRLREAGQLDAAIALYTAAIAIKANDERTFNNRGMSYFQKGDFGNAIIDFTEAMRLAPYSPLAFENRAVAYERLGEHEKADADASAGARVRQQYGGR